MSEQRKPTAAFWLVVVTVGLVLYPLSVGPALWLYVHVLPDAAEEVLSVIYAPLVFAVPDNAEVAEALWSYIELWVSGNDLWLRSVQDAVPPPSIGGAP